MPVNGLASMDMIGYATIHAKQHERSEEFASLEEREIIIDHLTSETEKSVATPKLYDKSYH